MAVACFLTCCFSHTRPSCKGCGKSVPPVKSTAGHAWKDRPVELRHYLNTELRGLGWPEGRVKWASQATAGFHSTQPETPVGRSRPGVPPPPSSEGSERPRARTGAQAATPGPGRKATATSPGRRARPRSPPFLCQASRSAEHLRSHKRSRSSRSPSAPMTCRGIALPTCCSLATQVASPGDRGQREAKRDQPIHRVWPIMDLSHLLGWCWSLPVNV